MFRLILSSTVTDMTACSSLSVQCTNSSTCRYSSWFKSGQSLFMMGTWSLDHGGNNTSTLQPTTPYTISTLLATTANTSHGQTRTTTLTENLRTPSIPYTLLSQTCRRRDWPIKMETPLSRSRRISRGVEDCFGFNEHEDGHGEYPVMGTTLVES